MHPRRGRLDLFGAAVSCACACHCVVLPLALALVPATGLGALLDERIESGLLAVTALAGTVSFGPAVWGAARNRGWWRVPALFAEGVLLLFLSRVLADHGNASAEAWCARRSRDDRDRAPRQAPVGPGRGACGRERRVLPMSGRARRPVTCWGRPSARPRRRIPHTSMGVVPRPAGRRACPVVGGRESRSPATRRPAFA
jgi:hypothetical protein